MVGRLPVLNTPPNVTHHYLLHKFCACLVTKMSKICIQQQSVRTRTQWSVVDSGVGVRKEGALSARSLMTPTARRNDDGREGIEERTQLDAITRTGSELAHLTQIAMTKCMGSQATWSPLLDMYIRARD